MSWNTATLVLSNTSSVTITFATTDAASLKRQIQNCIQDGLFWDAANNAYPVGQILSVTAS